MGLFNAKYPYTDFHELNLDWLLTTYQQIVDDIKALREWSEHHQGEYEAAMIRLRRVENEIATFEARVQAEFDALSAEIQAELEQQKREMQQLVDDTKAEINRMIVEFQNQMEAIKAEMLNALAEMRAEVNRLIDEIRYILQANNQYVFNWVELRIQQFIDSLPEILTVQVYNPYRGEVTDIQIAINDLYEIARIWGLTAQEYDSLRLTAQEYDALGLTAAQYDTLGYRLLFKDPNYYMLSPFTGELVHIKKVIVDLAGLHMNALTASEYDAFELDADTYDAKDLTAYNYDWNGAALLP